MFSTVAGGFEFSRQLGRPVGPGQANWMASAYSSVVSYQAFHPYRLDVFFAPPPLRPEKHILIVFSGIQPYTECIRPHQRPARRHIRTPEADASGRSHHHPFLHSQCLLPDIRHLCCRTSSHRSRGRHTYAQRRGHPDHHGPSGKCSQHHTRYICSVATHRSLDRSDDCRGVPPVFAVEVALYLPVSMIA